jgi:hypothetical protein
VSAENLGVALELAGAGIFVFPAIVVWNDATKKLDKRPAISGWRDAASTDPQQIEQWWATFPAAVPGIELGRSGLFVVDLDRHAGGADGVAAFKTFRGDNPAPRCPSVKTASGGYHLYFRQPEGGPLGNRTGTLPPGVDIRGDGGWTVAPGAVFEHWRWGNSVDLSAPPAVPDWIVSAIRTRKNAEYSAGPSPKAAGKRERTYAERALNNAADKVAAAKRGTRNGELNTAAFCMGTMIGAGWLGHATVEGKLWDAAASCGLLADDGAHAVRSTIKSGIEAGVKQPHANLQDRDEDRAESTPERAPAKPHDPAAWREGAFTAADLQGMEFTPTAWLVPNIIPSEGVALLASRPKFGKSWLAYDLCIGATADRYILGDIKPRQGDVLYLALEDSKRRLQRRMDKLLPAFNSKWPSRLTLTTEWKRFHEGGIADIRSWHDHTKAEGGRPILVIVDVLAKARKPTGNRPAYEADYEALTGLAKLAHELAIAIIVVHHVRKMQSDDLMEMVCAFRRS